MSLSLSREENSFLFPSFGRSSIDSTKILLASPSAKFRVSLGCIVYFRGDSKLREEVEKSNPVFDPNRSAFDRSRYAYVWLEGGSL